MKNYKLILAKRLIIVALFAIFTNSALKAQSYSFTGSGTQESPYEISSTADWNAFAEAVSSGTDYSEKFFILTENIAITVNNTEGTDKIAGEWTNFSTYKAFSGTFDGNGKTITFNVGAAGQVYVPSCETPNAPFRVIKGATIENLHVIGNIYPKYKYNAGLVGFAYDGGTNTIKNCTSTIQIDCSYLENQGGGGTSGDYKKWDSSCGGLVTELKAGTLTLENCIFDGSITKGTNEHANRAAGLVGYNGSINGNTITFNNCLMAGTIDMCNPSSPTGTLSTFSRNGHREYSGNCLYCADYGDVPQTNCLRASYEIEGLSKKYTVDEEDYYIPVQVTELKNTVYEEPITVEVSFYGKPLEKDTDYTIVVEKKDSNGDYVVVADGLINDPEGAYRVTLTAVSGSTFEGESVYEFKFITTDEQWSNLVTMISAATAGGTIDLQNSYYATDSVNALEITKNLTINLNGNTIDRNLSAPVVKGQVLRIAKNVTVTINGPGTITGGYNKAETDNENGANNDGGGIYNMGNLVLNNVTVTQNTCIKKVEGTDKRTARGGGVYNGKGSSFSMTGGEVSHNVARGGGGGVFCQEPTSFTMTNVLISHNESESKGGGLRIITKTPIEALLKKCTIEHNYATATGSTRASEGGGVYMQDGKLRMDTCIIRYNKSSFAGAGFFSLNGTTYAKGCTIVNNSAFTEHEKMYGGGICLRNPSVYTMDDGVIENNSSFQDGGGIYVMEGATFNVLGNLLVKDNFRVRTIAGVADTTSNNTYMAGSGVLNIIGNLDPESRIYLTGHGLGGIYTNGLGEYAVPENFVTDEQYQKVIDEETGEFRLVPYDWTNPGAWFDQSWYDPDNPRIPTIDDPVVVKRALVIPENTTAYADNISFLDGTVIIKEGGELIINDHNCSAQVDLLFQKSITAVPEGDLYGWDIVSIPIDDAILVDDYVYNTNIITTTTSPYDFDLLRYDEPRHYWDSYTDHSVSFSNKFQNLTKGQGYLYRNKNNMSLEFYGTMNVGDVDCAVTYTASATPLSGFNLLGNPYTEQITILNATLLNQSNVPLADAKQLTGFYKLDNGCAWTAQIVDPNVKFGLGEGFLVQVPNEAKKVRFSKTARTPSSKAERKLIMLTVSNSKDEDRAYAIWDDCLGLNKISHINEDLPMLYINQKGDDYAIAPIGKDVNEFNLNLKATTTGQYTLNVKLEGGFNYLHLIDRLAQKDIDLLVEKEYTFIGSPADSEGRFIVRLGISNDDVFAYQSGNDIVVSGEGELQVYDVTGRMVMNTTINGVQTVSIPSNGVYIFKLNEMVQKIVVR